MPGGGRHALTTHATATSRASSPSRSLVPLALANIDRELLGGLCDVCLVLQQDVQRLLRLLRVDGVDAEQDERARPIEGLRDRRRLLELELPDRPHDARDLVGEVLTDLGDLGENDLLLSVEVRVVDMQVEATALQRL